MYEFWEAGLLPSILEYFVPSGKSRIKQQCEKTAFDMFALTMVISILAKSKKTALINDFKAIQSESKSPQKSVMQFRLLREG